MAGSIFAFNKNALVETTTWLDQVRKQRAKGIKPIDLAEFGPSIDPKDLPFAVDYEYARESMRFIDCINALRAQALEKFKGAVVGDHFDSRFVGPLATDAILNPYLEFYLPFALAGSPCYPTKPWASLNDEDRSQLRANLNSAHRQHDELMAEALPPLLFDTGEGNAVTANDSLRSWVETQWPYRLRNVPHATRPKLAISGFFMMNTLYSPKVIRVEFEKWLRKRHPALRSPPKQRVGRQNVASDSLNASFAMRLRYYSTSFSDAQVRMPKTALKGQGMYYAERASFDRACTRAPEYFRRILELPATDMPIRFRDGWQK